MRHIHADHMIAAANDTTIKWERRRRGNGDGAWTPSIPTWVEDYEYRQRPAPHPHQALMDIAAADPSIKWQCRHEVNGNWLDLYKDDSPSWIIGKEYRQKPAATPTKSSTRRDPAGIARTDKAPAAAMTAPQFLHRAIDLQGNRAAEYDPAGKAERSMAKIVAAFNLMTGLQLTEAQGWFFMQTVKEVRLHSAPQFHRDSAEDGISYASLKAEALAVEARVPT